MIKLFSLIHFIFFFVLGPLCFKILHSKRNKINRVTNSKIVLIQYKIKVVLLICLFSGRTWRKIKLISFVIKTLVSFTLYDTFLYLTAFVIRLCVNNKIQMSVIFFIKLFLYQILVFICTKEKNDCTPPFTQNDFFHYFLFIKQIRQKSLVQDFRTLFIYLSHYLNTEIIFLCSFCFLQILFSFNQKRNNMIRKKNNMFYK